MSMQIIPAIDLLDGGCVRLKQGDFKQRTNYAIDALELAQKYASEGAGWLHVVDLAASRDGADADIQPLLQLLKKSPQSVQTGGGVRDETDLQTRLVQGADRIVVGSICVTQTERFASWLEEFGPDRLVAALDVQIDGAGIPWPRTHGWTQGSTQNLWQILDFYADKGLKHLLCTDISCDGAMTGPNLGLYRKILFKYPRLSVQASGGVSSLSDLENLAQTGVDSAITGKALLDGHFTVAEAVSVLS
jgi:phosphoribosylformimino-5-aminoimidazole carboxamide ribotide isomerase